MIWCKRLNKTEEHNVSKKRYKVIACEILYRETCLCAALSRNIIDLQFMPKGLHDIGEQKMVSKLQSEIDRTAQEKYDAILLVYGLCNNGIRGLRASIPLVIPRAHDCITLLMGSREKYQEYFDTKPGTYFKSTGWIERDVKGDGEDKSIATQLGIDRTYAEYVAQYGEENAAYLMEQLGDWLHNYQRLTYIDTGTGNPEYDKKLTAEQARERNWDYEEIKGDLALISRLFSGDWNEQDFLFVKPDRQVVPSYDETVITCAD